MTSDDTLTSDALDRHVFDADEETRRLRRTMHEQTERIARLADESERQKRTLDEQSAHIDLLNTRMAYLTEHRDGLRDLMTAHHERLLERDAELQRTRERLADVDAEAQRRHDRILRLQDDLTSVAAENQKRGAYIEHLTGHLAAVEAESLARKVYIEHLEAEWAKLRGRLHAVEAERARDQEDRQRLEGDSERTIAAFAKERAWLQQRIATLETAARQGVVMGRLAMMGRAVRRAVRRWGFMR